MENILIIGRGKTGCSVGTWAHSKFITVSFFEDEKDSLEEKLSALNTYDALVLSPSVKEDHPLLIAAKLLKIPAFTDIDLFLKEIKCPTIGITGTNGKSTTTALIGHILNNFYKNVFVGGNIGIPVLELIKKQANYFVLELSSYQLCLSNALPLDISVLLNITPDHLAYHGSLERYIKAKERIFENTKNAVISIDDDYTKSIYKRLNIPSVITLSTKEKADFYLKDGHFYHRDEFIMSLDGLYLKGEHNAQNILASMAVSYLLNIPFSDIVKSIKSFKGLSHRQECVTEIDRILFINDSKATNADAAEKALLAYQNFEIFWILGGLPKSDGITPLVTYYKNIKKAYTIGQAMDDFYNVLTSYNVDTKKSKTLDQAVIDAFCDAKKSETDKKKVILFSPACASQDQFQNFEERGAFFIQCVHDLKR